MIFYIILIFFILLLITVKYGSSPEINNIYGNDLPVKEITKKNEIEKNFKGVYISKNNIFDIKHIWKWEDDIYFCYSNLFLPFARFNIPLKKIDETFLNLIKYEPEIFNIPYYVPKINIKLTFKNKYFYVKFPANHSQICVDYFQEEVRMLCVKKNKPSHWQFFKKKYGLNFGSSNEKKYNDVQLNLWNTYYSCTEIYPEILVGLVKILRKEGFFVKKILDMSAGRGSRLTAAAALVGITHYLGVDPNSLSHEWYDTQANYFINLFNNNITNKMIIENRNSWRKPNISERTDLNYEYLENEFYNNPKKEVQNFKVLKNGFVEAEIVDYYDIMFSSPPYFDVEIYSNDKEQSINKYSNIDAWINNFMKVSMAKIIRHLKPSGLMCINISNSMSLTNNDLDYVNPILGFNLNCSYLGCISFYRETHKLGAMPQPIFIWQKKAFALDIVGEIRPWISYFKVKEVNTITKNNADFLILKVLVPDTYKKLQNRNFRKKIDKVIWNIKEDEIEFLIKQTDKKLPFVMFQKTLDELDEEFLEFDSKNLIVKNEKITLPYTLPENVDGKETLKFMGDNVLILTKYELMNCLGYFTEYFNWVCHRISTKSMWDNYLENYEEITKLSNIYSWFSINGLGCKVGYSSAIAGTIRFLRSKKFKLKRVLDFNMGNQFTVLMGFIVEGCEYFEGWNPKKFDFGYEKLETVYNCWNSLKNKINKKKFNIGYLDTKESFDCVFCFIPSYNIENYFESDRNTEFNTLNSWLFYYLIPEIKKSAKVLEKGGILCIKTVESVINVGGWSNAILSEYFEDLEYLGCIGDTINYAFIFTTFIWKKK